MSFTDHKITQFAHRVADLPDEPQIPAADLKSRFDACPEELRQSLNAVCDDAARLEARVEGIVVDTFGDTIDKEMLSDELAAELDGKATQTALDSTANALDERLDTAEAALVTKAECYWGTYTGNGQAKQVIPLDFTPKCVILMTEYGMTAYRSSYGYVYGGMFAPEHPLYYSSMVAAEVVGNTLQVYKNGYYICCNEENTTYFYLLLK